MSAAGTIRDLHLGPQMIIRTESWLWPLLKCALITQTRIHVPSYFRDEPVDHGEACKLLSMKQYAAFDAHAHA